MIDNLGEKESVGYSDNGDARNTTAQVCDVNKSRLSVKRMVQAFAWGTVSRLVR